MIARLGGRRAWARAAGVTLGAASLALGALLLLGPPASASVRVQSVRAISPPSPFPGPCAEDGNPLFTRDSDVEPHVAVDPTNPRNVVVAWIQDDGSTNTVAASRDGARTFARVLVPGLTRCTGGTDAAAGDPVVSFGSDGRVLLASGVGRFPEDGSPPITRMAANRSGDRGFSWSKPSYPQPLTGDYWDKPWVTIDPRQPKRAYYVWSQRRGPERDTGEAYLSRSNDFGRTWSPPSVIATGTATSWPQGNMVSVLPNGTLVDVFVRASGREPSLPEMAARSTDGGRTWSDPTTIGVAPNEIPVDRRTGDSVLAAFALPSSALAADGTLYVAWNHLRPERRSRIMVARSTDGGRTWTARAAARSSAQVFAPSIALSGDGIVGVSYYRVPQASRPDGTWPARVLLATSRDRGRQWRHHRVAGPFDMRTAEQVPGGGDGAGYRPGDYFGLAGRPHGFVAAFVMAQPQAKNGPQDVFVARIRS